MDRGKDYGVVGFRYDFFERGAEFPFQKIMPRLSNAKMATF